MSGQKIRIRLKSFDHRTLEQATKEIVIAVKRTGADVSGPIPLPRTIKRFTVNRSPHVNKKSREQFEIRTQRRVIIVSYPTPQTIAALKELGLPAGIDVEIKLMSAHK